MQWIFWAVVLIAFVLYLVNRWGKVHADEHPLVQPGVSTASESLALCLIIGSFIMTAIGDDSFWALIVIGGLGFILLAYVVFVTIRLAVLLEQVRFRDRLPKYRRVDEQRKIPTL